MKWIYFPCSALTISTFFMHLYCVFQSFHSTAHKTNIVPWSAHYFEATLSGLFEQLNLNMWTNGGYITERWDRRFFLLNQSTTTLSYKPMFDILEIKIPFIFSLLCLPGPPCTALRNAVQCLKSRTSVLKLKWMSYLVLDFDSSDRAVHFVHHSSIFTSHSQYRLRTDSCSVGRGWCFASTQMTLCHIRAEGENGN